MHDSIGSLLPGGRVTMVDVPGPEQASASHLVPVSVVQLHPEEAVFAGMLRGWDAQMSARALSVKTREARLSSVRRFMLFASEYPWQWQSMDVDDWSAHLRDSGISHSTL